MTRAPRGKEACQELHELLRSLDRHTFPFDENRIPADGIYILFEKGEAGHSGDRIVRVGTHTGKGQLLSRLKQHFIMQNKDRSIFRKNIGRALLNQRKDPFLAVWEVDRTPAARERLESAAMEKQRRTEEDVTKYIQERFSFAVIPVRGKEQRLRLESRIISTIAKCAQCGPSPLWFGLHSPKEKIRKSGLWLVNELYKEPLSEEDMREIRSLCAQ